MFYTDNRAAGYLKKSDRDLNVFWYRPHHDSSVGVFNARLPAVRLQERRMDDEKKITFGNKWKLKIFLN